MTRLIRRKFWGFLHHYFGIRLGFSIPINVFDYGLRINHYGTIVVNTKARIGKWCDIHACVNIGESLDKKAPCLGDNCWIGPGAKLFGGITIGNGVMIGAGSVVNKSFTENNITIVGVPARKIKDTGDPYHRMWWISMLGTSLTYEKDIASLRDTSRGDQDGSFGKGVPKKSGSIRDNCVCYRSAS